MQKSAKKGNRLGVEPLKPFSINLPEDLLKTTIGYADGPVLSIGVHPSSVTLAETRSGEYRDSKWARVQACCNLPIAPTVKARKETRELHESLYSARRNSPRWPPKF